MATGTYDLLEKSESPQMPMMNPSEDRAEDEQEKDAFLKQLLQPERVSGGAPQPDHDTLDTLEAVLLDIWRQTFGDGVSADDNYFALGGDSLKSVQISARAGRAGLDVTMQDIVDHATVRQLAGYLRQRGARHPIPVDEAGFVPAREDGGWVYPSTAMQEGMVFQCMAAPDAALYISQFSCVLTGPIDPPRFGQALALLVRRHPALRAAFPHRMLARHCQLIHDQGTVDLTFDAGSRLLTDEAVDALLTGERIRPFDLGQPPLLRVRLIELAPDRFLWIWTQHHLVADGHSQERLLGELASIYRQLQAGEPVSSAEDPAYRDALIAAYARRGQGKSYWRNYLAHLDIPAPAGTSVPMAVDPSGVAEISLELTDAETKSLSDALAGAQLTVGSAFLAWFAIALAATFDDRDMLVGLVTSGRNAEQARHRDAVGNLISTLPFRATINRGRALRQWMAAVQRNVAELQKYEQTSLQDIKRWVGWPAMVPLFQAIFVHENYRPPHELFGGDGDIRIEQYRFHVNEGYPLVLVCDTRDKVRVTLRYLTSACSAGTARHLLDRLMFGSRLWLNGNRADDIFDIFDNVRGVRET